uniref:Uncharacterized protein n=1 Tax=Rhizophagus irregularis (strain DAOM 181602 / DAOM 197198 / MUCL 43194) TaxID=747089 RepID=U9T1I2_RHIID
MTMVLKSSPSVLAECHVILVGRFDFSSNFVSNIFFFFSKLLNKAVKNLAKSWQSHISIRDEGCVIRKKNLAKSWQSHIKATLASEMYKINCETAVFICKMLCYRRLCHKKKYLTKSWQSHIKATLLASKMYEYTKMLRMLTKLIVKQLYLYVNALLQKAVS